MFGGFSMSRRFVWSVAALVLLVVWTCSAWGGIAISSSLSLRADADDGSGLVTSTDSQSQGATVNPLAAFVDAFAGSSGHFVDSTATGFASWSSPNVGNLVLFDVGWTTVGVSNGFAALSGGLDYTYTFMPNLSGTFTLNFGVAPLGVDTFGLNGFNYNFNDTDF